MIAAVAAGRGARLAVALGAVALVAGAGCSKKEGDGPIDRGASAPAKLDPRIEQPLPAGAVRVEGKNFHVDAVPLGPCEPGAVCTVAAELTSLNEFKVNREYPFKFVPEAGLSLEGTPIWAHKSVHTGRLLVPFKRAAGPSTVRGAFKLSVCSADVCQVETAQLAVNVP